MIPRSPPWARSPTTPQEALRALDADLAGTIERLQRARIELGLILRRSAPTDLPLEFAPAGMSEADRSFVVVLSRVLGQRGLQTYAAMLQDPADVPANAEFDDLHADADEDTRQEVAEVTRRGPGVCRCGQLSDLIMPTSRPFDGMAGRLTSPCR